MTKTELFRVRTSSDAIVAFDEWRAKYEKEVRSKVKAGDAFEELLRRVGVLPPRGKVF